MQRRRPASLARWAVLLTASLGLAGCYSDDLSEIEDLQTVAVFARGDQVQRTMEYIQSLERYEMTEFRDKVNSGLNRWITSSDAGALNVAWSRPQALDSLPAPLRESDALVMLDAESFSGNDANYLQQAYWIKTLVQRISADRSVWSFQPMLQAALTGLSDDQKQALEGAEDLVVETVALLHPGLSRESDDPSREAPVVQLATALKLFDWTIRNTQLLEAPTWPVGQELVDRSLDTEFADLAADVQAAAWPPQIGAYGPGYKRYPWQVLTYAKADYLDRAELFALLCRQANIDAAVLALRAPDDSSAPYQEWLPAVLIEGQFYLFDTQLGLPVPGAAPGRIATLQDVRNDGQLLRKLDLTIQESVDKTDYPVRAEQLDHVIGLVVAPPESVAKRMALLETQLTGDQRLSLTAEPDALEQRLAEPGQLQEVALWHVPFSTQDFRHQLSLALVEASYEMDLRNKVKWVFDEEAYIDGFVSFRAARNLYLRGVFETDRTDPNPNAITQYFDFMYSDEEVNQIEQDPLLQSELGIFRKTNQSLQEWQALLARLKSNMSLVRSDAAFFLAQCHYENGHPATSLNWLERIGTFDEEGRWGKFVNYQLGRAHEAMGLFTEAAKDYSSDRSAQRHGNLLRKRWMDALSNETG